MHRAIMKVPPGMTVDPMNLDGLDNRKRRLQNCTNAQNSHNNRSRFIEMGFENVRCNEQMGKYKARVGNEGDTTKIGEFDDPIEAATARDHKARDSEGNTPI